MLALLLAVTGITLNHTDSLSLDTRAVSSDWLLDWYDIETPQRLISYQVGHTAVSLVEDRLYIGEKAIAGHYETLAGAVSVQGILVVAVDSYLVLLTAEGDIIERLTDINKQVETLLAVGTHAEHGLVVRTAGHTWLTDIDFSSWQPLPQNDAHILWATPMTLPATTQANIYRDYRSRVLNMERVMLDLHSGRLFGEAGVWVMDAAAVLFMLLAASGFWMWLQGQRKRAQHRRAQKKPG